MAEAVRQNINQNVVQLAREFVASGQQRAALEVDCSVEPCVLTEDNVTALVYKVSRLCTRNLDNFSQIIGVFKHRTGTQMIIVKRLIVVKGHKQRALECFKKCMCTDV